MSAGLGEWQTASIIQLHKGLPFTSIVGTRNLSGVFNPEFVSWTQLLDGLGLIEGAVYDSSCVWISNLREVGIS